MKRWTLLHTVVGLSAILATSAASAAGPTWMRDTVDARKYFDRFSERAIALDAAGRPHIAYGGDQLYHAYFNGTTWQFEMIDSTPGVGERAVLRIDPSGRLHIVYSDYVNNIPKYATNASGTWTVEALTAIGQAWDASMAVDPSGKVHISCSDGNGTVFHTTNASGTWTQEEVYTYQGNRWDVSNRSIAIGTSGSLHLLFRDWPYVMYATNASGSWESGVVAGVWNGGGLPDMAVDSSGTVHIAYGDADSKNLQYATGTIGSWTIETVDAIGVVGALWDMSIAVDATGKAHIAYRDDDSKDLKYAVKNEGGWAAETLDSGGDVGRYPAIAVGASGTAHISYLDTGNGALKYASGTPGHWTLEVVDSGSANVGFGASLAVDTAGRVHIGYVDLLKRTLWYSGGTYGQWQREVVDPAGGVDDWYVSTAADASGNPHISYPAGDFVRYATKASGAWSLQPVAEGSEPSMALAPPWGIPHLVYRSYSGTGPASLWHATRTDGVWDAQVLGTDNFFEPKVATDTFGAVHVVYPFYDAASDGVGLKYASNASGSWTFETLEVPQANRYFIDEAVAVDASGNVHVVYVNDESAAAELRYSIRSPGSSGSWSGPTPVWAAGSMSYASLAVDGENWPHITFSAGGILRYAVESLTGWEYQVVDSSGSFSFNRIALDAGGNAHIAYRDMGNKDVKYATNAPRDEQGPDGTNPGYDGNADGTPDSEQANVASFHTFDAAAYVTLASEAGTAVQSVEPVANPSPINPPAGVEFPYGFVQFSVAGVNPGSATLVTLVLPAGAAPSTYYKYGPTPDNAAPHWYEFLYDGQTGAEIRGNVVTLHFVDGGRGDGDLETDGTIVDPGSPGFAARFRISGGAYNYPQSPAQRATFSLDAKGPATPSGWLKYLYTKTRMNFVSTAITSVSVSGDMATVSGNGTVNGARGYTFTATVVDGARDAFGIEIRKSGSVYYSASPAAVSGGSLHIARLP